MDGHTDDSSILIQNFNFINFDKLVERSFNDLYLIGMNKFYPFFLKEWITFILFYKVICHIIAIGSLEPTFVQQKMVYKRSLEIANLKL